MMERWLRASIEPKNIQQVGSWIKHLVSKRGSDICAEELARRENISPATAATYVSMLNSDLRRSVSVETRSDTKLHLSRIAQLLDILDVPQDHQAVSILKSANPSFLYPLKRAEEATSPLLERRLND